MPLQQISVSPLDWSKERSNVNQQRQKNLKHQDPVFTTSGINPLERCPSQTSTLSNNNDICRICHCESEEDAPLIAPCYCAGSLRYVHQACLQQWIKSSDIRSCELCKFQFVMQSKLKPFSKWESLEMNGVERRKLLCSVTFHAVALTCVVWSLYVLVDRTIEEIHRGLLEWPFWTKLIVVAIGFAGGIVFMHIQCKAYLHLCRRWRAFNRVIYVQNAPEKVALPPAAAVHPPKLVHQDSGFTAETCCGVVGSEGTRGHRLSEAMVINIDANGDVKTSLGSPPASSKHDCESGNCPSMECERLPDECRLGMGDMKVIVGTSSGTNFYVDAEDVKRTLHFNDSLPGNDECLLYEERSLLRNADALNLDEERSRLLGEIPSSESEKGKIVKSGFQLLTTGTRQTSQSDDKLSKNLSVASCLSSSSSEDSFKSLSIQLLQNQKPMCDPEATNTRPWTSLNSCSTWIEKPTANNPQENVRPKSLHGSQSPLLTTVGITEETK